MHVKNTPDLWSGADKKEEEMEVCCFLGEISGSSAQANRNDADVSRGMCINLDRSQQGTGFDRAENPMH